MTKYIYKGKEISHLDFLSLMRNAGIASGWRKSNYEHLVELARKGNGEAIEILTNLRVEK